MSRDIRDSFPSKYLKAGDLQGRPVPVVIKNVEYEAVGQDRTMKPVLYFRGKEKGMVLNKTNCNTIIQLTQTPDPDEWVGVSIVIYPTETSFGGEQVDCIRVRKDAGARERARPAAAAPRRIERAPEPEEYSSRTSEPAAREPGDDDSPFVPLTDDDIPF